MRNSENEFREQVLVHAARVVAIVDPFLCNLIFHLDFTVQGCKHSIDAREQLCVLVFSDVFLIGAGRTLE